MIIDTAHEGKCSAAECGATVFWRVEKSGRSNPYNTPEPCGPCQGAGEIAIHKLDGVTYVNCQRCDGRGRIQVSHFSSCPAAPAFRKKAP